MADVNPALFTFNRGIVSRLGLARTDLKRLAMSAEIQDNWIPRSLGSMTLRPGLGLIGQPQGQQRAIYLPFIFSTDPAVTGGMMLLEFTPNVLRIWEADTLVSRVAVATTVTNGTFSAGDLTGWTNGDSGSAVSSYVAGVMQLLGDGTNRALESQQLTVAGGDINKVHALRVVVAQGFVQIRIGSTLGAQDLLEETTLGVGTHSLAFQPSIGAAFVEFYNSSTAIAQIASVAIEAAGVLTLPTSFGAADISMIRVAQSANVVYAACNKYAQIKIEHRQLPNDGSWSIVSYQPVDGPFQNINVGPITLTIGALNGPTTLTASAQGIFKPGHVGALFRIASTGQVVRKSISSAAIYTDPIKVTGVGATRALLISITGTFVGTLSLSRSIGNSAGPWLDVGQNFTTTTSGTSYNDGLDNQIIYYRIGFNTGNYTSGTATPSLSFQSGSINGICRVTSYVSPNLVNVSILKDFGSTNPETTWYEGIWSGVNGYPTAVAFDEGRLTWAGRGSYIASIPDAYESFDDTVTGDSAPIIRTIGSGPLDVINWLVPLLAIVLGAQGAEWSARSDALTDAITAANINFKDFSTQGSAPIAGLKVDTTAIFVQRSGNRLFLIELDNVYLGIYKSTDLTLLVPRLAIDNGGFVKIAVQRSPDTRIHCLMGNGRVAMLIFDQAEDVKCWVTVSLRPGDVIEDIVILPGVTEDQVYYQTFRQINGLGTRFLEKWAREDQTIAGLTTPLLADCYITRSGAPTTTIAVPHLNGDQVFVFADGKDQGQPAAGGDSVPFTVIGGNITLPIAVSNAVIGLGYTAQFKSSKLAYGAQMGSALNQMKEVKRIGLVMTDTHVQGIQYGTDFQYLDYMPPVENGAPIDLTGYWVDYDNDQFGLDGNWTTDERICLQAAAPRPVTIEAVSIEMETNE